MSSIFASLPFEESINAARDKLAVVKSLFLEWDAAARSRAITMANVRDQAVLESVHDELVIAINDGKTYAEFEKALTENQLRGWTGTGAWHQRLVYEQNLSMAYSAGRVEQGTDSGLRVWRYLASISAVRRQEHEQYYDNLYRFAAGSPVPPIDFNCTCGWEWVFPHELEAMGMKPEDFPAFDPPTPASGFVWSPAHYADLALTSLSRSHRYEEQLGDAAMAYCGRPFTGTPEDVVGWIDAATEAGAELAAKKLERILAWSAALNQQGLSLQAIANRILEARPQIASNEDSELDYQATFAAWLRGRVVVAKQAEQADIARAA